MPHKTFGPHLTIDGYGADPKRLGDEKFIHRFLDFLPTEIKMTKIMGPCTMTYHGGKKPDEWGVSGFVIIAESHISIHTFPSKGYFSVDIFSCKEFDAEKAVEIVKEIFSAKKAEVNFLWRGKDFPMEAEKASAHIAAERLIKT